MRVGEVSGLDPLFDCGAAVADRRWLCERARAGEAQLRKIALRLVDRPEELDALSRLVRLYDDPLTVRQLEAEYDPDARAMKERVSHRGTEGLAAEALDDCFDLLVLLGVEDQSLDLAASE
jgi:hypothetical protein